MMAFLLEVTPPAATVTQLGEALAEAGWELDPHPGLAGGSHRPTEEAIPPAPGVAAQARAGARYGGRLVGEWRPLDQRGRLWAFWPEKEAEGESLVRQLLGRCAALDRVWLPPPFLAQAWYRLAVRGGGPSQQQSRWPVAGRTQLLYSWSRLPLGEPVRPPAPQSGCWLSSVLGEEMNVGTGFTWSDRPGWVQSAGGPLRPDLPLPAALAGFRVIWEGVKPMPPPGGVPPGLAGTLAAGTTESSPAGAWIGLDRAGVVTGSVEPLGFLGILVGAYEAVLSTIEERLRPAAGDRVAEQAAVAAPGGTEQVGETSAGPAEVAAEVESVGSVRGRGTPLTALFEPALAGEEYQALLAQLRGGGGSLRLWGKAQAVAAERVEVEALDLHGRRPVVLDLSPRQLIALFPERGCANSVLRIAVHLIHQVRPVGSVFLGDQPLGVLVQQAWGGVGVGAAAQAPVQR